MKPIRVELAVEMVFLNACNTAGSQKNIRLRAPHERQRYAFGRAINQENDEVMLGRRNFLQVIGLGALFGYASDKTCAGQSEKKEIHLIDVFVAAFQCYDGMKEDVIQSLQIDNSVVFKGELEDRYDEDATLCLGSGLP